MKSNYKKLGDFIRECKVKNEELAVTTLLGINIDKFFMPSVANVVGTDMSVYKIVKKNQFACNRMHVGRDERLPVALSKSDEEFIVSPAYDVFEITDTEVLLPEFLMMWFSRREFDRNAWFYTDADVRGGLHWKAFCDMQLPIPHIDKQKEIVKEYNVILNRIALNNQLIQKLEETAQAIYKQWFVDFEFPDENGKSYKSNGGEMEFNAELEQEIPKGWKLFSLKELCSKIGSGSTPDGGQANYQKSGVSLVRSMNVHDFIFSFDNLAFINEIQAKALSNVALEKKLNITGVSVARCCIVPDSILPARVNQHVLIIRPKSESLSYYVMCMLCDNENKSKLLGISQSGSTREALTKSEIENFRILIANNSLHDLFQQKMSAIFKSYDLYVLKNKSLINFGNILLSKLATIEN